MASNQDLLNRSSPQSLRASFWDFLSRLRLLDAQPSDPISDYLPSVSILRSVQGPSTHLSRLLDHFNALIKLEFLTLTTASATRHALTSSSPLLSYSWRPTSL